MGNRDSSGESIKEGKAVMKARGLIGALLLLPLIAMWGCEGEEGPAGPAGPQGPAGTDGAPGDDGEDGVDGSVACLSCHSTETQEAIVLEYSRSQHALGEFVDYAGGRASCARCHSGNGYSEFMETGEVAGDILNPTPFLCQDCHNIHETFEEIDYALRGTDPVAWLADEGYGDTSVDFGNNSNVCANCHQARRPEPNVSDPGDTFEITSTHYGPHHGSMANVVAGTTFAEIPGSTAYPSTNLHVEAGASCVTCHMGDYADGAGGHSWWPSLDACQACHSTSDFDYGNVQTEVQGLLDDLQALLLDQGVIEWVEEDEAYEPVLGVHSMDQAQAFYNWIGLTEDRSLGVHNPRYVVALLENSIEAITP